MKVKSVKIQNFKSFAEENNRIDLDNINTIVGKNESGKSNLIQAIGKLELTGINDINYFKNLTNKLLVDLNDIKFVDGTNKANNNLDFSIEGLFSEEDKNNIGINNEDYSDEKAYYSLELLKRVINNEYKYSDETLNNFDKIIKKWLN